MAGPDQQTYRNVEVSFDGSWSYDRERRIISYFWDFGDESTGSGVKTTHTYATLGNYTVTLTVTDDVDQTNSDQLEVRVVNQFPHAEAAVSPQKVKAIVESVTFDGSASFDPDGEVLTYSWDFSDNETGDGEVVKHTYEDTGEFFVTLTVQDNDGGRDTVTVAIAVEAPLPPDLTTSSEDISLSLQSNITREKKTTGEILFTGPINIKVDIRNLGDLNATNVLVGIYSKYAGGGRKLGSETIPLIAGGSSTTLEIVGPWEEILLGLKRETIVKIDPNNEIMENKTNNIATMLVEDGDGDGLADLVETPDHVGTNSFKLDTDNDGLSDGEEIEKKTDPSNPDTDKDGVKDGEDTHLLRDLLATVEINHIKMCKPVDYEIEFEEKCFTFSTKILWYKKTYKVRIPYPVLKPSMKIEPYFMVRMDPDAWESNHWVHSEIPIAQNVDDYSFSAAFPINVPDDKSTEEIRMSIKALDYDRGVDIVDLESRIREFLRNEIDKALKKIPSKFRGWAKGKIMDALDATLDSMLFEAATDALWDDSLEISGSKPVLDITYNLVDETWVGDTHNSVSSGGDATIQFNVYREDELPYEEQLRLAEEYSPILYFHEEETWFPRDVRDMLENANLWHTSIVPSTIEIVDPKPVSEASLAKYYAKDNFLSVFDPIPLSPDEIPDTPDVLRTIKYGLKVYAHVFTAYNYQIVIQYWFFYLYDVGFLKEKVPINWHEGDWEMIQLILPQKDLSYSYHYSVKLSSWEPDIHEGNHPIVYVEKGGHANLFSGDKDTRYDADDYKIEIVSGHEWLAFRGNWGAWVGIIAYSGPPGPVFRYSALDITGKLPFAYMWTDPIFWARHPTFTI